MVSGHKDTGLYKNSSFRADHKKTLTSLTELVTISTDKILCLQFKVKSCQEKLLNRRITAKTQYFICQKGYFHLSRRNEQN